MLFIETNFLSAFRNLLNAKTTKEKLYSCQAVMRGSPQNARQMRASPHVKIFDLTFLYPSIKIEALNLFYYPISLYFLFNP